MMFMSLEICTWLGKRFVFNGGSKISDNTDNYLASGGIRLEGMATN